MPTKGQAPANFTVRQVRWAVILYLVLALLFGVTTANQIYSFGLLGIPVKNSESLEKTEDAKLDELLKEVRALNTRVEVLTKVYDVRITHLEEDVKKLEETLQ